MPEFETRTLRADELRFIIEDDRPRIDGRAIVYNALSEDMGGWFEVIDPGAIVLDDDLRALFDHDTSMVLGRTKPGTLQARDDGAGIVMTAYPPDTQWARDLAVSMGRGDIDQMSFRMWVEDDDVAIENDMYVRHVKRAQVSELSVVSMPAYASTTAQKRAEIRDRFAALEPQTDTDEQGGAPEPSSDERDDGASSQPVHVFVEGVGFVPIKEGA